MLTSTDLNFRGMINYRDITAFSVKNFGKLVQIRLGNSIMFMRNEWKVWIWMIFGESYLIQACWQIEMKKESFYVSVVFIWKLLMKRLCCRITSSGAKFSTTVVSTEIRKFSPKNKILPNSLFEVMKQHPAERNLNIFHKNIIFIISCYSYSRIWDKSQTVTIYRINILTTQ